MTEQEYNKRVALELLVDYVWAKERQKQREREQCQDNSTASALPPPS